MLKSYLAIFLIIIFVSCNDNVEPTSTDKKNKLTNTYTLKVLNKSTPINNVQLQGFFGDQKIEIDNRNINDTVYSFEFSESDISGVYRLQLDNVVFDFIYNKENIEIELTPVEGLDAIEIIKSEENKKFYNFLKEYAQVLNFSENEICDEAKKLKENLIINSPFFADNINSFLYNSTFNCSQLNHASFINRLELNSKLLHTPYFTSQISTVINSAIYNNKNLDTTLNLLCKNKSDDLVHFIRNAFWTSGIQAKNKECLESLFSTQKPTFSFNSDAIKLFNIGDKFENDLYRTEKQEIKQHIFLFEGNGVKVQNEITFSLKEKIKNDTQSTLVKIDINDLSEETQRKYNLFNTPIILVFGPKKELRQRYLGKIGLEHARK